MMKRLRGRFSPFFLLFLFGFLLLFFLLFMFVFVFLLLFLILLLLLLLLYLFVANSAIWIFFICRMFFLFFGDSDSFFSYFKEIEQVIAVWLLFFGDYGVSKIEMTLHAIYYKMAQKYYHSFILIIQHAYCNIFLCLGLAFSYGINKVLMS
jgi:hypothetical protein